jgi:hypothetical protein
VTPVGPPRTAAPPEHLKADVRNITMKTRKRLLIVVALSVAGIYMYSMFVYPHRYSRHFIRGDREYYKNFSLACKELISSYPDQSNDYYRLTAAELEMLPPIIKDLNVNTVSISRDRVHLLSGGGFTTFAVSWERTDEHEWTLYFIGPGFQRARYVSVAEHDESKIINEH